MKELRFRNIGFLFFAALVILVYIYSSWGFALLTGIIGFCIGLLVKYGIRDKKEVDDI